MIEVPETIVTPEGVAFKPRLGAVTSFDGSYSSTYKRQIANWVCGNTMRAGLNTEHGQEIKVRHTKNSDEIATIQNIAQATNIAHSDAAAFKAEVASLCDIKVSEGDWEQFLETLSPSTKKDGTLKTGSSATISAKTRSTYDGLWRTDPRVAPWQGSAWGVVQAVNTYAHHLNGVRSPKGETRSKDDLRAERNMRQAISGEFGNLDAETFKSLQKVLA
jgi:phage/plasmid-like protein (TIGR03299 family)